LRESDARTLEALRRWSVVLDSAFRVPGTQVRFGLDPILGLLPGLGDLATPLFSALLLCHAVRLHTPRVVQLRMLLNAAMDLGIGAVPLVGDLFDVGWKANMRNVALLERHARPGSKASPADWAFVVGVLAALLAVALTPIVVAGWLLSHL
jgi:uncharacterized protein DUF4112